MNKPAHPSDFTDALPKRTSLGRAMLKQFSIATGMPTVRYEVSGSDLVLDDKSQENFTLHCAEMMRLAPEACGGCHLRRAKLALNTPSDLPTQCHRGLFNQAVPIVIDDKAQMVVLYGQMRKAGTAPTGDALARLPKDERERMDRLWHLVPEVSSNRLAELNETIREIARAISVDDQRVSFSIWRVVHDLNTRMQGILASAENMQDPSVQPIELRMMSREILQQVKAFDATVQALGNYLGEYSWEDKAIEPLVEGAIEVYSTEASRAGIKVNFTPAQGVRPSLRISQHHLQHVLYNLVHNAIKYSFRSAAGKERFVMIECKHTSNAAMLTISNYGIGILQHEHKKIFEDGYQGELTKGENRTGSGKGLFFVKQVIDDHGGTIRVDSTPMPSERSRGPYLNKFSIWLPHVS